MGVAHKVGGEGGVGRAGDDAASVDGKLKGEGAENAVEGAQARVGQAPHPGEVLPRFTIRGLISRALSLGCGAKPHNQRGGVKKRLCVVQDGQGSESLIMGSGRVQQCARRDVKQAQLAVVATRHQKRAVQRERNVEDLYFAG